MMEFLINSSAIKILRVLIFVHFGWVKIFTLPKKSDKLLRDQSVGVDEKLFISIFYFSHIDDETRKFFWILIFCENIFQGFVKIFANVFVPKWFSLRKVIFFSLRKNLTASLRKRSAKYCFCFDSHVRFKMAAQRPHVLTFQKWKQSRLWNSSTRVMSDRLNETSI